MKRVRFVHAGTDARAAEAFFGAPVELGADADELQFPSAVLARPMQTADPEVAAMLEAHAQKLHARLAPRQEDAFIGRVRAAIAASLRDAPSLESVAAMTRSPSRALQRRLSERGTSFTALLDEVRRDIGVQLVRQNEVSLVEVAFELGFADPATLFRAFRRWTGTTPHDYRLRAASGT